MTVDICGQNYIVEEYDGAGRTEMSMGRSDSLKGIISLNKNMPADIKTVTLIHEWLHAVLDCYGFEETNNENLVNCLSIELNRQGFKLKDKEEKNGQN